MIVWLSLYIAPPKTRLKTSRGLQQRPPHQKVHSDVCQITLRNAATMQTSQLCVCHVRVDGPGQHIQLNWQGHGQKRRQGRRQGGHRGCSKEGLAGHPPSESQSCIGSRWGGCICFVRNTTGKPVAAATPGQASSGDSMANGPQTTDGTGQTASDAAAAGGSSAAGDSGTPAAGGTDSSKLVLGGVAVAALVIVILIVVLLSRKKKLPAPYMQMPSPAYYPMQQPMFYGPPGRP